MKKIVLAVLIGMSTSAFASPLTDPVKQDFITTMNVVRAQFKERYALTEWKNYLYHWSIDGEIDRLIDIGTKSNQLTVRRAQELVFEFFTTARDYHATVYNDATGRYTMDIRIRSAENRAFITSVAPTANLPLAVGDEVLKWDGVNVMNAILAKKNLNYPNYDGFDQREADTLLITGYEMLLDIMPTKPTAELLVKKKGTGDIITVSVPWKITPSSGGNKREKLYPRIPELLQGMAVSERSDLNQKADEKAVSFGSFPKPATVLWETTDTIYFSAWIGQDFVGGKKIGFIRIPSFSLATAAAHRAAVREFEGLVSKMQNEADVLLLDLMGNPGGMLDYAWALASPFFSQPVEAFKFSYRIWPALVNHARSGLQELSAIQTIEQAQEYFEGDHYYGFPVDLEFVRDMQTFYQGIVDDSAAGRSFGLPRYYNSSKIKPNPNAQYTKPLFVLTDEGSISCGDMFPALLQDTGRAKLIGRRTAGAGAFVGGTVTADNPIGMKYMRIPLALGYRYDGMKIENIGVQPDYEIPLTAEELESGYKSLQEKVFTIVSGR